MWIIFFALCLSGSVRAMSDAEVKMEFEKVLMSCFKDNPVEMSELIKLKALWPPNKTETKCLLACTYKKIGTMNAKGVFDLEKFYELAETTKAGEEKAIANGKKLADVCIKVNEKSVGDAEKGCERAALMFNCIVEHAPKFGFTI